MERAEVAMLWLHVGAIWFLRLIRNAVAGNKSTECVWGWDCKASGAPGASDLFASRCWAGGKSEDCVSHRQVTQTNPFQPVLAPAQPAGESALAHSPALDTLAMWKSHKIHGCDRGAYPCCGLVFPGAVELVQSRHQEQPPLLGLKQMCWAARADTTGLVQTGKLCWFSSHGWARVPTLVPKHTRVCIYFSSAVSCSGACCSLDQVQQLWTLPPSLCSDSNCPGHCWLSIPQCRIFLMLKRKEELGLFSLLPRKSSS